MGIDRTERQMRHRIPARIAEVRGARSQRGFARDLGVFQQNVNRYESGVSVPAIDFLRTIAIKERVSLDWLVLGRGKKAARV